METSMPPKTVYSCGSEIKAMTEGEVRAILEALEVRLRGGSIKYVADEFFSSQTDEIKKTWPEPTVMALKGKARELAGQGQSILPKTVKEAVIFVCENVVAGGRAKAAGTRQRFEFLTVLADISLSILLRRAPDASVPQAAVKLNDGKVLRIKASETPRRMVVNCDEAKVADVFLYCYCNLQAKLGYMLGWATQEDVLKAKSGNKASDPGNCSWDRMAYYVPLESLRPMSEFVQACGIADVPNGVLMERPPKEGDLPCPRHDLKGMVEQGSDGSDYLSICGIEAVPAKPASKVQVDL
jgi:hypothetical protein